MPYLILILLMMSRLEAEPKSPVEPGAYVDRAADSMVLVKLYENTKGNEWFIKWNLSQPMNTWFGVELDFTGRVLALRLQGLNLQGPLPSELGNLRNLRILYLYDNHITGLLPSSFGLLGDLEELNIESNQLDGIIPNELSNASALRFLNVSKNNFSGSFPIAFYSIPFLQELNASDNFFTGPIPSQISNLVNLRVMNLGNNALSGTIPSSIGVLRNLKELYLSNNKLSGPLPLTMSLLTGMQSLWLDRNQFTGDVVDLTTAPLISLRLDFNRFTNIPDYSVVRTWGSASPLGLVIHHNQFTFEDLIPLQKMSRNSNLEFSPQNPIPLDSLQLVNEGSNYAIRLNVDGSISDNNYKWLKDNQELLISNQNFFQIINASETDEGYYGGSVRNNAINNFELQISRSRVIVYPANRCNEPLASDQCDDAPIFCSTAALHNYCGFLLTRFPTQQNGYYCDSSLTTQNQALIQFIASADSIVLEIVPSGCSVIQDSSGSYLGMQAAIFEACDSLNPLYCQSLCLSKPFLIGGNGFVQGRSYTLLLDGCNGNNCEYIVRVLAGRKNIELLPGGIINGERAFCPDGNDHFFTVSQVKGASQYLWYVNDSFFIASPDTIVNIKNFPPRIYKLAMRASNQCDTTEEISITFQVFPKMSADSVVFSTVNNDSAFITQFILKGGTPPYKLKNGLGVLDSLSGKFSGRPQLCKSEYFYEFEDKRNCIFIFSGFQDCACISIASDLPSDTLRVCEGQNLTVTGLGNQLVDTGDVLLYMIYTDTAAPVASMIRTSSNGVFPFDPVRFKFNIPFYVSQIITKNNNRGQANLLHPCLSISNPQVVYFYPRPIMSGGGNPVFCGKEGLLVASGNIISNSWRKISGPGNLNFSHPDSNWTEVKADSLGTFIVELKGRTQFCERTINLTVKFQSQLQPEISGFRFVCPGQSTTLDAGSNFLLYRWTTGESSRTIKTAIAGTYCVTVTDANFCTGESCVEIMNSTRPELEVNGADSVCTGDPITIGTDQSFISYLWSNGQSTSNISIDTGGNYCLVVQAENGCLDTACIQVISKPRGFSSLTDSACHNVDYFFGGMTFKVPGTYQVKLDQASKNGCDSIIRINLISYPVVFVSDTIILPDNGSSNGVIRPTVKGGKIPYRYNWSNGATTLNLSNIPGGVYTLTVRDANNCIQMFSFTVPFNVATENETSVQRFHIFPNPAGAGQVLYWKGSESLGQTSIQIFDSRGIRVSQLSYPSLEKENFYTLNNDFTEGLYLIRCEVSGFPPEWHKLIILKN